MRGVERSLVTLSDGRSLDVVEIGDPSGPVVFFLHGTPGGPLEARSAEAAAQAVNARVVAAARPGYADSTPLDGHSLRRVAEDLIEVADRRGIERFAVLGVSGGGPAAIALAITAGAGRVTRLGILAGVGPSELWDADDPEAAIAREALAAATAGDLTQAEMLLEEDVAPFVELVRTRPPAPMPETIVAAIVDGTRHGLDGYVRDVLSQGLPWDVDPGDVPVPTRLVYGDADRNVPASHGRWFAERIDGSVLEIVPDADHPRTIGPSYPAMLAFLAAD